MSRKALEEVVDGEHNIDSDIIEVNKFSMSFENHLISQTNIALLKLMSKTRKKEHKHRSELKIEKEFKFDRKHKDHVKSSTFPQRRRKNSTKTKKWEYLANIMTPDMIWEKTHNEWKRKLTSLRTLRKKMVKVTEESRQGNSNYESKTKIMANTGSAAVLDFSRPRWIDSLS